MRWNWQQSDWPHFRWDKEQLKNLEAQFIHQSGVMVGAVRHFKEDERQSLVIDLITKEAIKTSEIEGEYLDRDSVQSSILRKFGLKTDKRRVGPAEHGIAEMMTDLYMNFDSALTHHMLFKWHKMLSNGRQDLKDIGTYRTHEDPMQVISGHVGHPKIHFEAPPSQKVKEEMDRFLAWWQETGIQGKHSLPALTRAGIAHLYFVCIHPFEDGNGRIGRHLVEKALSQSLKEPSLIAISQTIQKNRKAYYEALESNNTHLEITNWLIYFSKTILEAQSHSIKLVDFTIKKTKFYDHFRSVLNSRQEKVIKRIFAEGLDGFKGGLSAENYIKIANTSRATATRDLKDLLDKKALFKTGELKSTRYYLNI